MHIKFQLRAPKYPVYVMHVERRQFRIYLRKFDLALMLLWTYSAGCVMFFLHFYTRLITCEDLREFVFKLSVC